MNLIKVQALLPEVKRIQTISELLLLDALNIVAESFYNSKIDARGIKFLKSVATTHAYAHVAEKANNGGMLMDVGTIPEYKEIANVEFRDTPINFHFIKNESENEWTFVRAVTYGENNDVFRGFFSQGYLQVVAHVMLYNYINRKNIKLRVVEEHKLNPNSTMKSSGIYNVYEYCHLLTLKNRGNKILNDDNFELLWDDAPGTSQEWAAYCINHKMQGFFAERYTAKTKYSFFKSQFAVGDVILVYSRVSRVKKNNAQSYVYINTCYPAVVLAVSPTEVTFVKYLCVKTRLTAFHQYQYMLEQGGGGIYTADEIYAFPSAPCTRRWEEIGVEGYTYNENEVIVTPMEDDETQQWLTKTDEYPWCLNTLETIYAVFEDRGVKYNKARYLEKYFKGKMPVYDKVVRGGKV